MLVGREEELTALAVMLDGVRDGRGGALVLHGEVGAGKSALLEAAAVAATERGVAVVRDLPAKFRSIAVTAERDRYRLGLEIIEWLAAAPTVLIVDDAERLPHPSWEVLASLGRRLRHHPVALLAAIRDAPAHRDRLTTCGLAQRVVAPLPAAGAGRLLDSVAPDLPAATRERVLAEAEGSPLAITELARAASGTVAVPPALGDLLASLSPAARAVLLVVALGPGRAASEVLPALSIVERREISVDVVESVIDAGLLDADDENRLWVRHPLLRAAFRHHADPAWHARIRAALSGVEPVASGPSNMEPAGPEPASVAGELTKLRTAIERTDRTADRVVAADLLNALAVRFYWTPPDAATLRALGAVAESLGLPAGAPRLLHMLAISDPVGRGGAVLEQLERLGKRLDSSPYELHLLGVIGNAIGAFDVAAALHAACLPGLRAQGQLAVLARALTAQAWAAAQLGHTGLGLAAAEEARPLALRTHQPMAHLIADLSCAHIEALRGNYPMAEKIAETAERSLIASGVHGMLAKVCLVRGVLALGERRFDDAFRELRRIFDETDHAYHPYLRFCALAPLAEAGHLGDRDADIVALAEELEPVAARAGSPMLRHGLAYARAVTATDDMASELFQEARAVDLSGWPLERGRLDLAYGTWLGRRRRTADAQRTLRSALATFEALGADAWSARTRRRLHSVTEPTSGAMSALAGLTEQQRRVARLAAAGLTSREIADRLFVSPRTVTTHLSRIYARVAAGSRAGLARMLADQADTDT
jgi:DNA-binding CsgD family transcriptional regulator